MKTNVNTVIGSIMLIFSIGAISLPSCTKEEHAYIENDEKYIPPRIVLPTNSLAWDESYHPDDVATRANNQSDQMAVTSNNIYLGAVYSAQSVEELSFDWIPNPVDPIDVSYTFPRYFLIT